MQAIIEMSLGTKVEWDHKKCVTQENILQLQTKILFLEYLPTFKIFFSKYLDPN